MVTFSDFFPVVGVDRVEERQKVQRRTDWQSEDPKHLIRPMDRVAFKMPFPTSNLCEALSLDQSPLTGPKLILRQLLLGYVNARTDISSELISSVERYAIIQDPAIFTVGTAQPVFHPEAAAGVK
jgi:hypothetical protein